MAAKKSTATEADQTNQASTENQEIGEQPEQPAPDLLETAFYYYPEKNATGGAFPGVPLRHLSAEEVADYPKWIVRSIEASEMYSNEAPVVPSAGEENTTSTDGEEQTT